MEITEVDRWYDRHRQEKTIERLIKRVGVTRSRAECFMRLWIYLSVKQQGQLKPPLPQLALLSSPVSCSHREAAELFYGDKDRGSDRSAGMMLDKLAALGLIRKEFDGNITRIEILPIPEAIESLFAPKVELKIDKFDPRCDPIPVGSLLAANYNWMNRNAETMPYRIAQILREWAHEYDRGMRVLRRSDNLNPVGFYMLYPTASESVGNFFMAPSKSLHLSEMSDIDPFIMAKTGDPKCISVYVRSWAIEPEYLDDYRIPFLEDAQQTLIEMQTDFPNLCDLYTLIIHPSYEQLGTALGFQRIAQDRQSSVSSMYLPIDRFLALNIRDRFRS
jgi:hypothetical protein